MRLKLLILTLIFLNGCAVNYHKVSDSKIINSVPKIDDIKYSASVLIKRDNQIFGSALDGRLYYDNIHIVTLSQGETISFLVNPGKHKIAVKSYQPFELVPVKVYRELDVNWESGQSYEYVITHVFLAGLKIIDIKEYNESIKEDTKQK